MKNPARDPSIEFKEVQVCACVLASTTLKSFDEDKEDEAGAYALALRHWMMGEGVQDRRILLTRIAYHTGTGEVYEYKVQWSGEQGAGHAWTGEAFKAGMDHECIAALVGSTAESVRNHWGMKVAPVAALSAKARMMRGAGKVAVLLGNDIYAELAKNNDTGDGGKR